MAGDRRGLAELQDVVTLCRQQGLLALQRAAHNFSYALMEEGDWTASVAARRDAAASVPGGHTLATAYFGAAMAAYFDGDWQLLVDSVSFDDSPLAGSWDLQGRGMVAWIRVLRGEDVPDQLIDELLASARRTGFHRVAWTALGQSALCLTLLGRRDEARSLLVELGESWQKVRAIASGEWLHAATHAAVFLDRPSAVALAGTADRGAAPHVVGRRGAAQRHRRGRRGRRRPGPGRGPAPRRGRHLRRHPEPHRPGAGCGGGRAGRPAPRRSRDGVARLRAAQRRPGLVEARGDLSFPAAAAAG
jgi:hypothetical protein